MEPGRVRVSGGAATATPAGGPPPLAWATAPTLQRTKMANSSKLNNFAVMEHLLNILLSSIRRASRKDLLDRFTGDGLLTNLRPRLIYNSCHSWISSRWRPWQGESDVKSCACSIPPECALQS